MRKWMMTAGTLFVLFAATILLAQNGNDLFQQALVKQTASGDIPGAIQIYERIVRDFSSDRRLAARALVQLGKCYESLGQTKSQEYYDQVVSKYADQTDLVAEAKSRLANTTKAVLQIPTQATGDPFGFAISPDGRSVVFSVMAAGSGQLWLHDLFTDKAAPISGSDLTRRPNMNGGVAPFWSPDGKSIAYFSDGKLKRIAATGGLVQVLADAPQPFGGSWSRDGIIVFATGGSASLYRVPADGSKAAESLAGMQGAVCPAFLPDNNHLLFHRNNEAAGRGEPAQVLWIGSLDNPQAQVLPVQAYTGTFAYPDQLLYATPQGLFAQRLDLDTLQLRGSPVRVSEQVAVNQPLCVFGAKASASGAIAYRTSMARASRQLVWLDRQGQQVGSFVPDPSMPSGVRIAPDGQTVALGRAGGGAPAGSLWVTGSLAGQEPRQLIAGAQQSVWSPTGNTLAMALYQPTPPFGPFLSVTSPDAPYGVFRRLRDNPGERPTDWSKDGRFLLYESMPSSDVFALPLRGEGPGTSVSGEPIPVAQTPAQETNSRFSPDSKWIAYQSNELAGRDEVFVQPFPGSITSRQRVSTNGGSIPKWRDDGRELYFLSADRHLMAVSVTLPDGAGEIQVGTPAPLFPAALPPTSDFDATPDGQRFLVNQQVGSLDAPPITILSNWTRAK